MTNYQQPNKQPVNQQKPKIPRKTLILSTVVVVFTIIVIVVGNMNKAAKENYIDLKDVENVTVEVPTEEQYFETSPMDANLTINQSNTLIFDKLDSSFVMNSSMQYPKTQPISDYTSIALGYDLVCSPLRSCTYRYDVNRIDISHSSGVVYSIMRAGYKEIVDLEDLKQTITGRLHTGGVQSVQITPVFVSTSECGRKGQGSLVIDDVEYSISLTYLYYNEQIFTIIGIVPCGSEDFGALIDRTIKIGGKEIS